MKKITSLLLGLGLSLSVQASDVDKQLTTKIMQAQQSLSELQKNINKENRAISATIERRLNQVRSLRDEAANMQRLADEQALSIDSLKDRVEKWQTQSSYQKHLLKEYSAYYLTEDTLPNSRVLEFAALKLQDKLAPEWQETKIITGTGALEAYQTLALGPLQLALSQRNQEAGFLDQAVNQPHPNIVSQFYQPEDLEQLLALSSQGQGRIKLDPSMGNAMKLQTQEGDAISHIQKGGLWAIPILFFGAFALIVSLIKAVQLMSLPKLDKKLNTQLQQLLQEKESLSEQSLSQLKQSLKGPQQTMIEIARSTPVSQHRDDQLVAYLMEYRHKVERFLGAIATTAAIAPLLGLLGTVSGMISTFMMMNVFGTGDAATVSGGISEALITTELGLMVAIPSLICSALLSRKSKSYNAKLETNAIRLSKVEFA